MAEGAVSSANIVGYVTYTTTAGKMDIHGAPFVNISDNQYNIQNIQLGATADMYGSDKLMIFNAATQKYTIYSWYSATYSEDFQTVYGPGWGNESWVRQDVSIDPGQVFWLQTVNDVSVTVPGAVIAANQNTTTTIGGKMDIFTGVFPVGLNIQDISLSGNADLYGSDKLMVFNAETQKYSIYSWYSTTYSEDFLTSYGSGWGNESWVRQDITLDIGQGFWLQTVGDCNVTFQAPEGL